MRLQALRGRPGLEVLAPAESAERGDDGTVVFDSGFAMNLQICAPRTSGQLRSSCLLCLLRSCWAVSGLDETIETG